MKKLPLLGAIAVLIFAAIPASAQAQSQNKPISKLVITEIKLGGLGNADLDKEYVTIYNQTDKVVNLNGWKLEYAKTGFDMPCDSTSWLKTGMGYVSQLSGEVPPNKVLSIKPPQLTDNKSGSLRLLEVPESGSVLVNDVVGWGPEAPCFSGEAAEIPSTSSTIARSLLRYMDCDNSRPINIGNDADSFFVSSKTYYGLLGDVVAPACIENEEGVPLSCEGVIISEVLPNPAGVDSGKEFIELHNPTNEVISLMGCSLEATGNANSKFTFGNTRLQQGEYRAFYGSTTGLTLANAAGGIIWLLSADNNELYEVTYPESLSGGTGWALFNGVWRAAYSPTPNFENKLPASRPCPTGLQRNAATNRCQNIAGVASSATPCKQGQGLNPQTGRCRSILGAAASLLPCAPHQVRNPETNRCKAIQAAGTLASCKEGQARNPDTNRCRAVKGAASLAPCKEGQERNPETNRCRKAVPNGTGGMADVKDRVAQTESSRLPWVLAGTIAFAAIAYGLYEWRRDIANFLTSIKGKARPLAHAE